MTIRNQEQLHAAYLTHDPFDGEMDVDIKMRKVKLVTTRKDHPCTVFDAPEHVIPAGSLARFESALVDGDYFGRYYVCTACMDRALAQDDGDDEE